MDTILALLFQHQRTHVKPVRRAGIEELPAVFQSDQKIRAGGDHLHIGPQLCSSGDQLRLRISLLVHRHKDISVFLKSRAEVGTRRQIGDPAPCMEKLFVRGSAAGGKNTAILVQCKIVTVA